MRRTAAILATAVLATACASAAEDAGTAGTVAAEQPATDRDGAQVEAVQDTPASGGSDVATVDVPATLMWSASTLDGVAFDAAELAGGDTILWMWAPWCSVCEREAPEVAAFLDDLPDGVALIGVAGRDDVAPMEEFVARHDLADMTTVVDADGSIWARYGVTGQPAYVFIDDEGAASVAFGAIGSDGLREGVEIAFG